MANVTQNTHGVIFFYITLIEKLLVERFPISSYHLSNESIYSDIFTPQSTYPFPCSRCHANQRGMNKHLIIPVIPCNFVLHNDYSEYYAN